jgi:competence ComEA-like helix-hairpin-helix protein
MSQPSQKDRLIETLFVRRAQQTVIAALVLAAMIAVGLWWWRNGGADGGLVDYDRLPQREARFLVNVNTAPAAELAELPGVGQVLAERIIEHRETQGPFRSLNDLKQVKGIGDRILETMAPHVKLE